MKPKEMNELQISSGLRKEDTAKASHSRQGGISERNLTSTQPQRHGTSFSLTCHRNGPSTTTAVPVALLRCATPAR